MIIKTDVPTLLIYSMVELLRYLGLCLIWKVLGTFKLLSYSLPSESDYT